MAGLPGSPASRIPAGADEQVRRMRDLERRVDELGPSVGRSLSPVVTGLTVAQATADSKSRIIFSTLAASGTDFSAGDVWYQRVAGAIIGQWEFTAGAWAARSLDGAVIANLDAGKITTGTLAAGTKITAGNPAGSRIELDSAGLRKYAADGTTVQVDLSGDVAAFSGLITGSQIIAGTALAARVELDSAGLRQYATDGTTVLLNTADNAMFRARGDSTAVGANAQVALTTGTGDTAVGSHAQRAITTGYDNTAVGTSAQQAITTGLGNTAIGSHAQQEMTDGWYNTAVGDWSQSSLTVADSNTAVGLNTQYALTTGSSNTVVGSRAQEYLTTGYYNTAVGPGAQGHLTTGHDNTAVGSFAQDNSSTSDATTTASYQTSIGPETGQSSATQVDGITTIGYRATAGAANATSIGREARADHAGSIALGYQTQTTQPNQVMVGPRDVEITDTTKGVVLVAPDTTRHRVTVANGGVLNVDGAAIGGGGGDAWTAWTPALTAAVTNPTLGTGGSSSGRYSQTGKTVYGWGRVLFGTAGTNAGSGQYGISLPVPALTTANVIIGYGRFKCAGLYTPVQIVPSGASVVFQYVSAPVNGTVSNATNVQPGAWTINDEIRFNFTYEAA